MYDHLASKAQITKAKLDKWDYVKLKSCSIVTEISIKMKKKLAGWKKMFSNQMSDSGLMSKIYKEHL